MNILLVAGPNISLEEPYDSGIEAFIVSFANQLLAEGHHVDVVAGKTEPDAKFKLVNPLKVFSLHQSDYINEIKEEYQFNQILNKPYDVIHYNMFYPHLLNAGLNFKNNSFLTLHSPPDSKRIAVYKKLLETSDLKFVAISKRIKNQYDEALNIDSFLISNGIDINSWPVQKSRERKYLLWSARITEEKNAEDAIRLAQYMQLPLIIAGRIVNQRYFDEKIEPHLNDQIQYVGHVTQQELNNLSKNAIAYIATATWQEPFGLAALEMLASGIPVVGFDTAVPINWESSCVLTKTSVQWQDLVELVIKSYTVNENTCRDFASSMTIQKMTAEYLKLYHDVLLHDTNIENVKDADENKLKMSDSIKILQ